MIANLEQDTTRNQDSIRCSTLIDGAYKQVFDRAYRLSGNRQDAEDLTQEACIRAWRGFTRFEGDRPFLNWMFRIVTHLHLDMLRNRRRRVSGPSLDAPVISNNGRDAQADPIDHRPNPEEELVHKWLSPDVQDAFNSLTPPQRALVRMIDIEDMERTSLAGLTAVAEATLRSRLHRAHRAMRVRLLLPAELKAATYDPSPNSGLQLGSNGHAAPHGSIAALAYQVASAEVVAGL